MYLSIRNKEQRIGFALKYLTKDVKLGNNIIYRDETTMTKANNTLLSSQLHKIRWKNISVTKRSRRKTWKKSISQDFRSYYSIGKESSFQALPNDIYIGQ